MRVGCRAEGLDIVCPRVHGFELPETSGRFHGCIPSFARSRSTGYHLEFLNCDTRPMLRRHFYQRSLPTQVSVTVEFRAAVTVDGVELVPFVGQHRTALVCPHNHSSLQRPAETSSTFVPTLTSIENSKWCSFLVRFGPRMSWTRYWLMFKHSHERSSPSSLRSRNLSN